MKLEDIRISLTRYRIDDFILIVPGYNDFPIRPEFVVSIILEKDFEKYTFPFFQIEVTIPGYLYRGIKKNPLDVRVQLNMKKGQYFEKNIPADDTTMYTNFINGRFYALTEETTPDLHEDILDEQTKNNKTYDQGYNYADMATIPLLLYEEKYLEKSKTIVNKILTSSTLTDAIALVCNKAGLSNVLMSPPNNNRAYKELSITPIPASKQLKRLCNEYGLHKSGSIVFFDLDKMYILDKTPKCTAFEKNEFKTTYICQFIHSGPDSLMADGCFSNPKEKYNLVNAHMNGIHFKDLSAINEQEYGNNFITIDSTTGAVTRSSTTDPDVKNGGSPTRVVMTNMGDSTSEALASALNECAYVMTAGFNYVDLDMFRPNKNFVLSLEEPSLQKYNREYRICKMTCTFENEGELWCPHVVTEFRG